MLLRAAADAIKFTVDQQALSKKKTTQGTSAATAATPQMKMPSMSGNLGLTPNITAAAASLPSTSNTPAVSNGGAAAGGDTAAARRAAQLAQLEREQQLAAMVCSLENKDACLMCGS